MYNGHIIMQCTGGRSQLWPIDSKQELLQLLNSVIDKPTLQERIRFYICSLFL